MIRSDLCVSDKETKPQQREDSCEVTEAVCRSQGRPEPRPVPVTGRTASPEMHTVKS